MFGLLGMTSVSWCGPGVGVGRGGGTRQADAAAEVEVGLGALREGDRKANPFGSGHQML